MVNCSDYEFRRRGVRREQIRLWIDPGCCAINSSEASDKPGQFALKVKSLSEKPRCRQAGCELSFSCGLTRSRNSLEGLK